MMLRTALALEGFAEWIRVTRLFLRRELQQHRGPRRVPWRWSLVMRGYLSSSIEMFGITPQNRPLFLSDWQRGKAGFLNNMAWHMLGHKMIFERAFSPYVEVPRLLARAGDGTITSLNDRFGLHRDISIDELLDAAPDGLIVKPFDGIGGTGVYKLERDEAGVRFGSEVLSTGDAEAKLRTVRHSIVVPWVRQAKETAALYPKTTNTVRVMTFIDPQTRRAFISGVVQRIGVKKSEPVDNWTNGGLVALVDQETGVIGRAATLGPGPELIRTDVHPDTGDPVKGCRIPGWDQIQRGLLNVAELYEWTPYIAWDVIPKDDGFCVLEGNPNPGLNHIQCFYPFLRDERVRRFFLHHGVISRRHAARAAELASDYVGE